MANFEGIHHIGQRIFNHVPKDQLLKCRAVCKSWYEVLDNPHFWLKKLNFAGQPQEIDQKWLTVIEITRKAGFSLSQITLYLIIKYYTYII